MNLACAHSSAFALSDSDRPDDPARSHGRRPDAVHPLGPIVGRRRAGGRGRLTGLVLAGGAIGMLTLARSIEPDPAGLGSHRQLGLAPCLLPVIVGIPCPTCGMTTAFAHAVRFQWVEAFTAQPVGLLLFGVTVFVVVAGVIVLMTGRYWTLNWYRVSPVRLVVVFAGLLLAGWLAKIGIGVLEGSYPFGQ